MCGIAGIWNRNGKPVSEQALERFTDSIKHRGPDGYGYHVDNAAGIGLGHRRLSILDTSLAGKQPMTLSGRFWITYNGEIFNFLEIKEELKLLGYQFKSQTDTEVFLAGYIEWGMECFHKFNGMWAAAIYDSEKPELILSRDRYGIKPLYYLDDGSNFAFASETIAFKNLTGYQRSFDHDNLSLSIADSKALEGSGQTTFKDIFQVKPGHSVIVTRDKMTSSKWWQSGRSEIDVPADYAGQVKVFQELFKDACRLRMRSDVSIGSALSGGLDSSSTFTMMHHLGTSKNVERMPDNWQRAFTLTFPGSPQDELQYAQQVARHVGQEINPVLVDYDNVDTIIDQTRLFDSVYDNPNFILVTLYKAMRDCGIKVSMDGHGPDEMLFGYPEMVRAARDIVDDPAIQKDLDEVIRNMVSRPDFTRADAPSGNNRKSQNQLRVLAGRVYRKLKRELSKASAAQQQQTPQLPFTSVPSVEFKEFKDITDHFFHTSFLPSILRNFDRASMQAGVEVRMPFMDYRLVEFTHALPFESKVKAPYGKLILRDAMQGYLPDDIRLRVSKVGLMAPMDQLFNRFLRTFIMDTVHSQSFQQSAYWDGSAIARFVDHKDNSSSWSMSDGMKVWPYINAYLIQ